ncbi:MAG: hypothetical protein ACI4U2_03710, partial [Christensenellaceae bacterium]
MLNIYFIFSLNISVLAIVGNVISYLGGNTQIWANYVIVFSQLVYLFLKIFTVNRLQIVRILKNTVY